MKKKVVSTIMLGLLASSGLTYAWGDIPGVTRPFDPGKYYSETEISYRDSTYTPFTMRDLAANGYMVKDVTRGKKNGISNIKTYTDMINSITGLKNKILELTGLEHFKATTVINDVLNRNQAIALSGDIEDIDDQNLFRTTETIGDPEKIFQDKDQLQWLNDHYLNTLEAAKTQNADSQNQMNAVTKAVEDSLSAEGTLSAIQADLEMQSLNAAAQMRRNAMLANYIALEAAHNTATQDKALRGAKEMRDGFAFRVADPYRPSKTDQQSHTRPEAPGLVDFQ